MTRQFTNYNNPLRHGSMINAEPREKKETTGNVGRS